MNSGKIQITIDIYTYFMSFASVLKAATYSENYYKT